MESGTEDGPQMFAAEAAEYAEPPAGAGQVAMAILTGLTCAHLLNDMIQAIIPAVYPMVKKAFGLSFTEVGLITFTFQMTGSLFQPLIGLYTDRRPKPYSMALGMAFTLSGLVLLAFAASYPMVILAAALVGLGSAVFHPEASRIARLASGGRHGFAQSLFQVGGNGGSALGPLFAALIIMRHGQREIVWFTVAPLAAIGILTCVGSWYGQQLKHGAKRPGVHAAHPPALSRRRVGMAIAILLTLIFSKYFYLVSMTSYYTFYLIDKFHVAVQTSQILLFVFLGAVAVGTFMGGPIGDRFGRKVVIWGSIVGVAPFTLALPHANLPFTIGLSVVIGLVLSSAFSAILVYATELVPGRVGLIAGLFFGAAFGMAGIGAAVLGKLADLTNIRFVYQVCAFLPLIGLLTGFLPEVERAG